MGLVNVFSTRNIAQSIMWTVFFSPYCFIINLAYGSKQFIKSILDYKPKAEYPSTSRNYFEDDAKHLSLGSNYSIEVSKWRKSADELKENLVVHDRFNEFYFQINALGLKGKKCEKNSSIKLIAVWGDSVVFGISRGWVELANDHDKIFLSGGLEGANAESIFKFAKLKNSDYRFDLNIFSLGWHSINDLQLIWKILKKAKNLPKICLMTLPYSISRQLAKKDLSTFFNDSQDLNEAYFFWGNTDYSINNSRRLSKQIHNQNCLTRAFALRHRIPLLDLERHFQNEQSLGRFRSLFFDLGHPRQIAYPYLGSCLSEFTMEQLL
jgi:hypothetical protein